MFITPSKNTGGITINKFEYILQNVSKPQQYIGNEYGLPKVLQTAEELEKKAKFLLCFPDTYDIGMSNLAIKILYEILDEIDGVVTDRAFLPEDDFAALMKKTGYELHSLNYRMPVKKFDAISFTLEYELNYSNVLHFLKLAGVPLLSSERKDDDPLIIAGGSACVNPEPISDFIDVIFIGDGENVIAEIAQLLKEFKKSDISRSDKIARLSKLSGAYVPSYYSPEFDGVKQTGLKKINNGAPDKVKINVIKNLDDARHPTKFLVPNFETVFNRGVAEIARGCRHACRFCQAGFIYRPYRERSSENIKRIIKELFLNTGYTEFTLSSLSASDHSNLKEIIEYTLNLNLCDDAFKEALFSVSLPSQRISTFSIELADSLSKNRKSGLTFAPEAGSQKLRDAINKNVGENDLYATAEAAMDAGYRLIKLYFMIGLPFETDEDLLEIVRITGEVCDMAKRKHKRGFSINVTFSTFVPKPHTPFQWARQASKEEISRKQSLIKNELKKRREVTMRFTRYDVSALESAFARGSRQLARVLLNACNLECRFDAWEDKLKIDKWVEAFAREGIDLYAYAEREIAGDEYLAWSIISNGMNDGFLKTEFDKAASFKTTVACEPAHCKRCGIC